MFYKEMTSELEHEVYPQEAFTQINVKFPLGFLEQGINYEFYKKLMNALDFFFRRER